MITRPSRYYITEGLIFNEVRMIGYAVTIEQLITHDITKALTIKEELKNNYGLINNKLINEFKEALNSFINNKTLLIGPVNSLECLINEQLANNESININDLVIISDWPWITKK